MRVILENISRVCLVVLTTTVFELTSQTLLEDCLNAD